MSILSVDNISPIGSGTSVTVNSAATLILTNANSTGVITATSFVGSGANLTGVLSNIVEDTSPQLGGNLDTNSKNIVFGDSSGTTVNRLTFGGQADLKLFHDGTNSVISNATGDLYINNNADTIIKPANDCFIKPQDGENGISVIGNGAVELYYDNSKKLETTSIGVTISGDLKLPDNEEVRLGNGNDLQLYHNGSQSYVTNNTGNLNLTSTGAVVTKVNTSEDAVVCNSNGSVDLYHDNSKKFETMSTGARIQGGLLFNSDTAAANTLDDYEEGTWTPDWRGSQALGTTSYGTYNAASYVKIGNQVTVRGHSQITGSSGGQGFWFINNLPFTCGGGDDRRYRSVGSVFIENFNFQDSETDILCFIERNNNDMQLRGNRDNLSGSPNIRVGMDSSFDVMWTITYPTT